MTAAAAVLMGSGLAAAQTAPAVPAKSVVDPLPKVDVAQAQARRQFLFARMLEKPDDLDVAFEYAALSVQVGDLEAGISTLERMLIFAPGLPRLQLELGVLYYRLNAYETARTYFESAVSGPDVPDEVRTKVQRYLSGIDQAGETSRFTGQIRGGIRYQSNANRAPTGGTVFLNGVPFTLDPKARGSGDGNVYGAGVFHLSQKLPSQGDSLEVDLVTYGSKQFSREELDVALAELTVGPAFDLARFGIDNAAIGFYGIGSLLYVDGNFYAGGGGAGVRGVFQPAPGLSLVSAFEYRYRDYNVSSVAPLANDRDGGEYRVYGAATYIVNPTMTVSANAYGLYSDARRGYLAYSEGGLSISPAFSFAAPFGLETAPWVFSPNAGFLYRAYDDADPVINATKAERDVELFVGADLTLPIRDNWSLLTETEYRHSSSNYDTRDFDNFSVSLSVVKSF